MGLVLAHADDGLVAELLQVDVELTQLAALHLDPRGVDREVEAAWNWTPQWEGPT
ncbi:MAG TPA: hypothetical protein VGO31_10255 [Microbacteriaceae bacterium]|jgi:hypothetical protein|nr:hypothetical protein [Microbacteriaceae bacterium]